MKRSRKKVHEGFECEVISVLEIDGLNVFYGDYQALFDVSATVASGEIVSLLGANGAGKTTTINTTCGFIRPRAGAIRFDGTMIHKMSANKIVEKGLIQIPEERMFPGLKVLSVASLLARAIEHIHSNESVSQLFEIPETKT